MAQFRAKKLDISGFVNIKIIRDHTKRYAQSTVAPYFSADIVLQKGL